MKIKFFKIKKRYRKENSEIDPDIYWKVLIILAALLMAMSFLFIYNFFIQTNRESVSNVEISNNKKENKEKEKIRNALEYFAEREKKSIEILNSPTSIIDPSI